MSFIPIPCPPASGGGSTPGIDVEQNILCDVGPNGEVLGTALAVYEYDDVTGAPTGPPTFVDPATGNPYVIQGVLKPCDASIPGVANIFATCADTPREAIVTGPNLVENGDFAQSEGIGNTSTAGPGFSTGYNPSVTGNLFDPMDGAEHFAYFDTNAGQVTGNDVNAVPIPALSTKSFAVNVGPNNATPILSWQVELVNGKTYEIGADVAIIYPPYAIEMQIDGVKILDMTAPSVQSQWQHRGDQFLWTGATGLHVLTLNSSDPSPQGNDHAFDNFSIREVTPAQPGVTTEVEYSNTVRAVVDQIVQTTGCNDDRRDSLLASLVDSIGGSGGSAGNQIIVDQICVAGETFARVTIYNGGSGAIVNTSYFGSDGVVEPAPVSYTQGPCSVDVEQQVLCDANGPFLRTYHYDNGVVTSAVDTDFQLGPYVPVPPIGLCPVEVSVQPSEFEFEEQVLCDDNGPFFRRTTFDTETQTYGPPQDFTLAGAPYVTVGTITVCGGDSDQIDVEEHILCDDLGAFIRRTTFINGVAQAPTDHNLAGGAYVPSGGVISCGLLDLEQEILCDDNGPFIRAYVYSSPGVLFDTDDYTLLGADYTPVGTVRTCTSDCLQNIGTVCYSPPVVGPSFRGDLLGSTGTGSSRLFTNFQGSGVDVTVSSSAANLAQTATGILIGGAGPQTITYTFSQPVNLRAISPGDMDQAGTGENFHTFTPPWSSLTGFLVNIAAPNPDGVYGQALNANPDGDIRFASPLVTSLTFTRVSGGGGEFLRDLEFALPAGNGTQAQAAVLRDCTTGALTYVDLQTGTVLDPNTTAFVECEIEIKNSVGDPISVDFTQFDSEPVILCDNNGPFLRTFHYTDGVVTSAVDTDFQLGPYVPVGPIVKCPETVSITGEVEIKNDTGNPVPVTTAAQTAASTIQRQTGAGAIAIPAGAKSVTFISLAGAPTIQVGAGTPVAVPAGATLTWSVDDRNQTLTDTFTGTGIGGDDFIIITTA